MRKIKRKWKKLISVICVISMYILNTENVYAMEPLKELIEESLISTNAKEYEMNMLLDNLAIKRWHKEPYHLDELQSDYSVDEPLGEYSIEKLKEYVDEDFRAEFEYSCGYYGSASEPHLIQVLKIYKDDDLYALAYEIWLIRKVVHSGYHFMKPNDFQERMKKNEENYK